MKQITLWICSYCDTTSRDKSYMEKHELECKYNPSNKRCHSCNHFVEPNFNIGALACGNYSRNRRMNPYFYDNSGKVCNEWTPNSLILIRELKIKRLKILKNKTKKNGKMWF